MAFMKRIKIDLWSLGIAAAVVALFAGRESEHEYRRSSDLTAERARVEAAHYLEGPSKTAYFDRTTRRWSVSDGRSTAWLDARSGQLLEVEFGASR